VEEKAAWVELWVRYGRATRGESRCYWLRWDPDAERPLLAYPGDRHGPPRGVNPHFSVDACGVVREWGHPDGPSSIPHYVLRNRRLYPGEGHPTGPSQVPAFAVRGAPVRRPDRAKIHRNPHYGRAPES
jgi:hypothetical protein